MLCPRCVRSFRGTAGPQVQQRQGPSPTEQGQRKGKTGGPLLWRQQVKQKPSFPGVRGEWEPQGTPQGGCGFSAPTESALTRIQEHLQETCSWEGP